MTATVEIAQATDVAATCVYQLYHHQPAPASDPFSSTPHLPEFRPYLQGQPTTWSISLEP